MIAAFSISFLRSELYLPSALSIGKYVIFYFPMKSLLSECYIPEAESCGAWTAILPTVKNTSTFRLQLSEVKYYTDRSSILTITYRSTIVYYIVEFLRGKSALVNKNRFFILCNLLLSEFFSVDWKCHHKEVRRWRRPGNQT